MIFTPEDRRSGAGAAWLAVAAVAVCAPWPGERPQGLAIAALVALLLLLGRPRGRERWAWVGVVVALAGALVPVADRVDHEVAARQLEAHCARMLAVSADLAADERLTRLFAVTGEALDPSAPFDILQDAAAGVAGRTIYLADDRGRLLAWGGAARSYPDGIRPLGPRTWRIEWSARRGVLALRDPIMVEGRMVGALTVADAAGLRGTTVWGMRAPHGRQLVLGRAAADAASVTPEAAPGVTVPVGSAPVTALSSRELFSGGLLIVFATVVGPWPLAGLAAVALGVAVAIPIPGEPTTVEGMILLLCAAVAIGRVAGRSSPSAARVIVVGAVLVAAGLCWAIPDARSGVMLPHHLLRPGWGAVWMVALAWIAVAWPRLRDGRFHLERRVAVAGMLAVLGLVIDLGRFPLEVYRGAEHGVAEIRLPRGPVVPDELWPDDPSRCSLHDAAPALAHRWGIDRWATPSRLSLVADDAGEVSSWGDLTPAGEDVRGFRSWSVAGAPWLRVKLDIATEPWSLLGDWASGEALGSASQRPVWTAVLTRSGVVAASLHQEVRGIDPAQAGAVYHRGAAWTRVRVGEGLLPARVTRRGDWLVAVIAHPPGLSEWVVRTAIAAVWAFLGIVVARPPVIRREAFATFGGRLRMLVAGGVVIPLVILTLFLQIRLGREEARIEEVLGGDALAAARYTVEHLGEGTLIDDRLAAWLARGWGGEAVFFDHARAAGVSRPDLFSVGKLPQLPVTRAYTAFLLGRDDPVISRHSGGVTAAGSVEVDRRRYLLQLYREDPLQTGDGPDAVDWLLTGGLLAALLALVATARIEERVSTSLRGLVALARRLVRGEPLGTVDVPRETDLAEVITAVRSMNEEVVRREAELRQQEELLRITLANLTPAVMVLEPDGRLSFANPSAAALIERDGEAVLDRVRAIADEINAGDGRAATTRPYAGRDVTWRVGVAAVPLPDGGSGLVAVIDDVSETVRLDRLRQLSQLARIVAHEVKNPLTPIRLWIQELDEARRRGADGLDDLLEEACREIAVQVERLQTTARSFSNLVALEHWQPETVDLAEVASAVTDGLGVLARRGIEVRHRFAPPGRAFVVVDRTWLSRALTNLFQNSLDALGDGPGEISIVVDRVGDRVVVEIEDSGGGVPAEQLGDLFSPHFSTTASGSGLGLALVQQVVARCQGEVAAENAERGLRVTIDLPAAEPGG